MYHNGTVKTYRSFGLWTRRQKKIFSRRRFGRVNLILSVLGAFLISFSLLFVTVQVTGKAVQANDPDLKPGNDTMHLTVPSMKRVKNIPVYTGPAGDKKKLDASALHLGNTGFPWDDEANVYIAGHRLGYPRTDSFLVFYDLNRVRKGDVVRLRDADGRRYVYRVFHKFVTGPNDLGVTRPPDGENIVSLQTCTLPNYTKRLIVQGKLIKIEKPLHKSSEKPFHKSPHKSPDKKPSHKFDKRFHKPFHKHNKMFHKRRNRPAGRPARAKLG